MLSTPDQPGTQRAAYLRNHRDLLRLHGRVADGNATPRTRRGTQRRSAIWKQFLNAKIYVEAALLEGVQADDPVVDNLGRQMTVTDPDAKRDKFMLWRIQMRV